MLVDQALQAVHCVPLKVGGIQVFGLHERNAQVKNPTGFTDALEFRQNLGGVLNMLQHRIANNGIKKIRLDWDLMQRGENVDIGVVETSLDVLVI